jgi:hypothetical protein
MLPSLKPLSRAFPDDEHVTPAAYSVRWHRGQRPGPAFGPPDITGNPVAKQSRIDPNSLRRRRQAPLRTPSDLGPEATRDIGAEYVDPRQMLSELREDNRSISARLREIHGVCDEYRDIATASLIETWIDETERRAWFLYEASRTG